MLAFPIHPQSPCATPQLDDAAAAQKQAHHANLKRQAELRLAAHLASGRSTQVDSIAQHQSTDTSIGSSAEVPRGQHGRQPRQRSRRRSRHAPAKTSGALTPDKKWESLCRELHDELDLTPAPPLDEDIREVSAAAPRLKKIAAHTGGGVAPPSRCGWVETEDRWYRCENGMEEWYFKPDDGAFFHAPTGMLWIELPGLGLVRADVAESPVGIYSAMLSFVSRGGASCVLHLVFQCWLRLCRGSAEVARAYGVSPQHDEAPHIRIPPAATGLSPTTRHVLKRGINMPPLQAAWIASTQSPGWFCSRVSPDWIYQASEEVLYHVSTSSLWKIEQGSDALRCSIRRIDTSSRSALLGFAEASPEVLLRICLASWFDFSKIKRRNGERTAPQISECIICMDHFLPTVRNASDDEIVHGGAVQFGSCAHTVCTECLGGYAVSATEMHQWNCDGLKCPAPGCLLLLTGETVLNAASLTVSQRESIATHLCRLHISKPVYCPNPACGAVFEAVGLSGCPRTRCSDCKTDFCRDCACVWHTGKTCAEYRRRPDAEDAPLLALAVYAGWQRCSNCGSMVERVDGCNHIACARCGHHFCYRCGGAFDRTRYVCLTEGCGIHQPQGATLGQAAVRGLREAADQHAGRWRRWFWEHEAIDGQRREYLLQWAHTARVRGDANAAMMALARRGPYAFMPLWQRRAVWEHRCPYCQRCGDSQKALAKHLRSMCREPVLACCERLFYNLEELDMHVRERHRL